MLVEVPESRGMRRVITTASQLIRLKTPPVKPLMRVSRQAPPQKFLFFKACRRAGWPQPWRGTHWTHRPPGSCGLIPSGNKCDFSHHGQFPT